jgi:filamentous hemagglutinin
LAAATPARADELQAALPEGAQGRVTMGVGVGRDAQGDLRTVVGTSEPKGYLRPGVTLRSGEELARGFGHAEDDIVYYMLRNDISPLSVSAGRPICPRCGRLIGGAGARPGSPLRRR